MVLDLQILSWLLYSSVFICTHWPIPRPPPPPSYLGSYTSALLVSQDRRHIFVTPWITVLFILLFCSVWKVRRARQDEADRVDAGTESNQNTFLTPGAASSRYGEDPPPPPMVPSSSVVDPHHFDADPDSGFHLMRFRIRLFNLMRIRFFNLMRIRIRIQILASNKGSNPYKRAQIGSYSIHFGSSSAK
jgi:hypothetical protein